MLTRIYFADHGQDFLYWDIDEHGKVVDCQPFQASVWVGAKVLNPHLLHVGGGVVINPSYDPDETLRMNYLIENLEQIPPDPVVTGNIHRSIPLVEYLTGQ